MVVMDGSFQHRDQVGMYHGLTSEVLMIIERVMADIFAQVS